MALHHHGHARLLSEDVYSGGQHGPGTMTVGFGPRLLAKTEVEVSASPKPSAAEERGERDQIIGLTLALVSTIAIGISFIVKKRGLLAAERTGVSATEGGYSYLKEPIWWIGMICMIGGEACNFAAYAFAPAVLVTPLGAISILVSAVLAHIILDEKLHMLGKVGCLLCMLGSVVIIMHAPEEHEPKDVMEIWALAQQTSFVVYTVFVIILSVFLILHTAPRYGNTNILVYLAICSLIGSMSVQSCKALGIALKLTFAGQNQFVYGPTYIFILVVAVSVVSQINYLNKSLNTFNTAYVSPIYYVMFTTLVIMASAIMYHEWSGLDGRAVVSILSGFLVTVAGVFLLKITEGLDPSTSIGDASAAQDTYRRADPGRQGRVEHHALQGQEYDEHDGMLQGHSEDEDVPARFLAKHSSTKSLGPAETVVDMDADADIGAGHQVV